MHFQSKRQRAEIRRHAREQTVLAEVSVAARLLEWGSDEAASASSIKATTTHHLALTQPARESVKQQPCRICSHASATSTER
jgi:hypothetical protein